MRARNREINIFNMSLLDILTGMLGAFLFLMLGMLPYYAKVMQNKPEDVKKLTEENKALHDQAALQQQKLDNLQKQLDELQKIVKQNAGGPMTAEQIQKLMDELNKMREQVDQLTAQLQEAKNAVTKAEQQAQEAMQQAQQAQQALQQARQQLEQAKEETALAKKDRDFWQAQLPSLSLISVWDTKATDIDVFALAPDGQIFGQKQEKILGHDVTPEGMDSHTSSYSANNEGLLVFLHGSGDYLIFYRVPANSDPASYANLNAFYMLQGVADKEKDTEAIYEDQLPDSKAALVKTAGLYAWCVLHYDDENHNVTRKPLPDKLPNGLVLPGSEPTTVPSPSPSGSPSVSPTGSGSSGFSHLH